MKILFGLCVVLVSLTLETEAGIYTSDLPEDYLACLKYRSAEINPDSYPGEEISTYCLQEHIWNKEKEHGGIDLAPDATKYMNDLFYCGCKQKPKRKRIRKEYRMMTAKELHDYHKAINMLKNDKSVKPNKYAAIANFHAGKAVRSAHRTIMFLAWHRIYLLIFECALREKIPHVTIPYWDSTADSCLKNPADSILFSHKFAGNCDGVVESGPYAHWHHGKHGPLVRNCGQSGELTTKQDIENVLSRTYNGEIMDRTSSHPKYNIERVHSKSHTFVGGNLARLATSPLDPMFFSLHAFFDCVWELFRTKQWMNGINPAYDFPDSNHTDDHPYRYMDGFTNHNFTNLEGFSNFFTDHIYECQEFPYCNKAKPHCGSEHFVCDTKKWCCVPKTKYDYYNRYDSTPAVYNTVQNNFVVDGQADIDQFCYLTVKVIMQRPPSLRFKSYAIRKGMVSKDDVYCRSNYKDIREKIHPGNPKSYKHHTTIGSGYEKVYITAEGENYAGNSIEYVIMDERFALSDGRTFIPIKDPGCDVTKVILSAFDSGGRLCRPFCRTGRDGEFEPCSGALVVDSKPPLVCGETYAKNILWRYDINNGFKKTRDDDVFVIFYCDFQEVWQWKQSSNSSPTAHVYF